MVLVRLGGAAALILSLAACAATPATSGRPASEAPSSAVVAVPSTGKPSPALASGSLATPRTTATAQPSPTTACPVAGSSITFGELSALPEACASVEVTIAGWWDQRRESDLPEGAPFGEVLRERVPAGAPDEGLDYGPWIGLANDAGVDSWPLMGHWTELRVQVGSDGEHCTWVTRTDESPSASFPPTLACPVFARLVSAERADPPAGALTACPDPSSVIRVEDFVRYPRDCFGSRTVKLAGWFDTNYVIGGWEAPWVIEPAWLWSNQIGPVAVLAQWSDATDREALQVHLRPGSAIASAPQNRWVVLRGHYAREAEYGACHYAWFGEDDGVGGPNGDDVARADCSQAFIAESVRNGDPG